MTKEYASRECKDQPECAEHHPRVDIELDKKLEPEVLLTPPVTKAVPRRVYITRALIALRDRRVSQRSVPTAYGDSYRQRTRRGRIS